MSANPRTVISSDPVGPDIDMDVFDADDGDDGGHLADATGTNIDVESAVDNGNDVHEAGDDGEEEGDDDDDDTDQQHHGTTPKHPYPHLREIGHLASWTVSSHKQRCGVAELRSPSIHDFWQSDGPQPHVLTIHFFKRVTICHMRLHVHHELDESYTPTRIQVWAGTAHHDLQLVTDMPLDAPKGWLDIDLSHAGGPSEFVEGEDADDQATLDRLILESHGVTEQYIARRRRRLMIGRGPTLRCFIIQVRILENHQNGKDTHLRGFQVFAKDHEASGRRRTAVSTRDPSQTASKATPERSERGKRHRGPKLAGIKEADWMGEMTIR